VTMITFRHRSFGLVLEVYGNSKNGWAHLHERMRSKGKRCGPTEARTT
jgi:hypothetical protein